MTAKSEGRAPQNKRPRTATVTYPYHPLDLCIKFAEAVKQIGNGRQDVDKSVLASHLKLDEKSGDFAQKIASSKTYGLLDGKSALQLTDAARSYFIPTVNPDKEKAAALLKFFSSPGAFQVLIEAHDGSKPPGSEIMGNVLGQTYGIPESWTRRVAAFFLRAGISAGAIEPDGFLRYNAKVKALGMANPLINGTIQMPTPDANVIPPKVDPPAEPKDNTQEGVVVWKHGKNLRVETPENLTIEIWEKLNKYIQAIKP